MEEIITRQRYSRQTGVQKRKKKNNMNDDMISTGFAAKMLIVVVVLSALALCKAADNPTADGIVAKAKVITTKNYGTDKYIKMFAASLGITPKADSSSNKWAGDAAALKTDTLNTDNAVKDSLPVSSTNDTQKADTSAYSQDTQQEPNLLDDTAIKSIADKYSFIVPVKGDIASGFGKRTDTLTGKESYHNGIDLMANMGASIKAALIGEVTEASSNAENGQYIVIKHNDGIKTVYSHCSMLVAKKGQKVNQGDVIAKVGNTESTAASYLHFEVWKDGKAVNPETLFGFLNK